jgi:hypothetical protein
MIKKGLLVLGGVVLLAVGVIVAKIGPRNVIGMIRYDQRRDGDLKVGDRAPEALLVSLDGRRDTPLLGARTKPLILVFGSFT